MAKSVNVILALKDRFSNALKKPAERTKEMQRQVKRATNIISNFGNKANAAFKKVAKASAVGLAGVTAGAGALGFSEAFNLEGYRLQLETATKDTKKAADIMRYSVDLANKTPFEGSQLVEGSAKFEAMGMSAKKWLPLAGDMAAATNKDFDQATEALIDAQSGELERLKEFGIKKADIVKKAGEMFKNAQVVNNQGQITDQAKFNDAMVALMQDRFAGGMEKQAGTVKGLWSTVTGVAKSALANMVGISSDGSVKSGSALEFLKEKIKAVADSFTKWQQDGTLDRISQTVTGVLSTGFRILGGVIGFVKNNMNWLIPVAAGLVGAFVAFNVITAVVGGFKMLQTVIQGVSAAQGILNFVMAMNPIGLVAVAIGVLIAVGVLLWKNWDTIKEKAQALWGSVQSVFGGIKDSICGAFDSAKQMVGGFFNWIGDKLGGLNKKIEDIPVIGSLYKGFKGLAKYTPLGLGITAAKKLSGHATGTKYFAGGATAINEGGRGEIVNLPNGTQIIPHDVSKKSGRGLNVNVHVTIQGNVIGNKQYADEVGNTVVGKIIKALNNT